MTLGIRWSRGHKFTIERRAIPMGQLFQGIIDHWNGYTQADVKSLLAKMGSSEAKRPDGLIQLTSAEMRALVKLNRPFQPIPAKRIGP